MIGASCGNIQTPLRNILAGGDKLPELPARVGSERRFSTTLVPGWLLEPTDFCTGAGHLPTLSLYLPSCGYVVLGLQFR